MMNDFEKACDFIDRDLPPEQIKSILKGTDDIKKSAALLNLDFLDEELASLLVHNLTNQSGPVRETCAYKINTLIPSCNDFFQSQTALDTLIASLNDVNPNVVRFMLPTLKYFEDKEYIFEKLLEKITTLYAEILGKPRRGKVEEHVFTKKCFKIYWSLEGIKFLISEKSDIIKNEKLKKQFYKIIFDLSGIEEYTVREKVAQILNLIDDTDFEPVKNKLKNDSNYFVKRQ